MKCLRSILDIKIRICGVKAVCMLLGCSFCFGVTDQIKHSINQPPITLHIGQWNLARGRHGHFVWLVFDTNQRFFDLKINFLFEFVSTSRSFIISRVRNVPYGDFDTEQRILILKSNFSLEFMKCFKVTYCGLGQTWSL